MRYRWVKANPRPAQLWSQTWYTMQWFHASRKPQRRRIKISYWRGGSKSAKILSNSAWHSEGQRHYTNASIPTHFDTIKIPWKNGERYHSRVVSRRIILPLSSCRPWSNLNSPRNLRNHRRKLWWKRKSSSMGRSKRWVFGVRNQNHFNYLRDPWISRPTYRLETWDLWLKTRQDCAQLSQVLQERSWKCNYTIIIWALAAYSFCTAFQLVKVRERNILDAVFFDKERSDVSLRQIHFLLLATSKPDYTMHHGVSWQSS